MINRHFSEQQAWAQGVHPQALENATLQHAANTPWPM